MGSRVATLSLTLGLIASLLFAAPASFAATKKPTAKPTAKVKVTVKATAKPTAKASAKPSAKVTAKATAKSSTKPTAKATSKPTAKSTAKPTATSSTTKKPAVKKPVVKKKKKKRAKVRLSPSPKPVWPPKGFSVEGEVYAKVPTAKELVGLISANAYLSKQIKSCTGFICGSVQVASETGCIWWEVLAQINDGDGKKLGDLTSSYTGSKERELKTLIIISPENLDKGGSAKISSVICHHEDRVSNDPVDNYKKVNN